MFSDLTVIYHISYLDDLPQRRLLAGGVHHDRLGRLAVGAVHQSIGGLQPQYPRAIWVGDHARPQLDAFVGQRRTLLLQPVALNALSEPHHGGLRASDAALFDEFHV